MFYIGGRKIKVVTGTKSQTVNVLPPGKQFGEYEWVIRLRPPVEGLQVMLQERNFQSIESLESYLREKHSGQSERLPQETVPRVVQRTVRTPNEAASFGGVGGLHPPAADLACQWEQAANTHIEAAIDQLVTEFVQFPYLHRVEHSIHCELFKILVGKRFFSSQYPMGRWDTQLIHKEWPEWQPRPDKGNRRGNFDLCIISPHKLLDSQFDDFRQGRLKPFAVIEMGLDYDLTHLEQDAQKLINSGIPNSYLIHLVRPQITDDFQAVERFLLDSTLKTAYVRHTGSGAYIKLLGGNRITKI